MNAINYKSIMKELKREKSDAKSEYQQKVEKINEAIRGIKTLVDMKKRKSPIKIKAIVKPRITKNLGITKSIIQILHDSNKQQTVKEIQEGLEKSGYKINSKNIYTLIYNTLARLNKTKRIIKKDNKYSLIK